MSFGLDENGLEIKTESDIKIELENAWKATFGQSINLDARSFLGQITGIISEREGLIWELIEEIYLSPFPDTAEGVSMDNVGALTGVARKPETFSVGVITLIGTAGTVVPLASVISVSGTPTSRFKTDAAAIILAGSDEVQTVTFLQPPGGGTFALDFDGQVTTPLASTSVAIDVENAIKALPNIDDATVSGSFAAGFVLTFLGANGLSPQVNIVVDDNSLVDTEEGTITTALGVIDQKFFTMQEVAGSVAFWIDEDDSGTTIPGGASAATRAVEITTINTGDNASVRATKVAAAMLADAAFSSASAIGAVVSYTVSAAGDLVDGSDGDTTWTFATTKQGRSSGSLTITVAETTPGVFPQIDVDVTAEEKGAIQAPSGSLSVIETPLSGWASAINGLDIVVGSDVEIDSVYKLRRLLEIALAGKATLRAVRAAVLELAAVTNVRVFKNNTSLIDSEGRPPNSLDIVVEGGDEDEIAEEIFDVIAGGIGMFGDITKIVKDDDGFDQQIKFSRPTDVPIHIEIDLATDESFPVDGLTQVRDLVVVFGDSTGIGNDVIVFLILCSFSTVPGITAATIRIGTEVMPAAGTKVVTAGDDSGDLEFSAAAHGLLTNNRITFTNSGGALPSGIVAGVIYHVVGETAGTFKTASTRGGSPIGFTNVGSGVHTVVFGGLNENIDIANREVSNFDTSRTTVIEV